MSATRSAWFHCFLFKFPNRPARDSAQCDILSPTPCFYFHFCRWCWQQTRNSWKFKFDFFFLYNTAPFTSKTQIRCQLAGGRSVGSLKCLLRKPPISNRFQLKSKCHNIKCLFSVLKITNVGLLAHLLLELWDLQSDLQHTSDRHIKQIQCRHVVSDAHVQLEYVKCSWLQERHHTEMPTIKPFANGCHWNDLQ